MTRPAPRRRSFAEDPPPARRERRSLTYVGGPVDVEGAPEFTQKLAHALDVERAPEADLSHSGPRADDRDRHDVHGFHSYPARLHPETAARLVKAFCPADATVLDPFCGSGTVLIEAVRAGRNAVGTDLNPLAVELSRSKLALHPASHRAALLAETEKIVRLAEERRHERSGPTVRYPPEDVALFASHVLLELDSLRAGIDRVPHDALRRDLALALSAILVKLSRKQSDTIDRIAERRIAAGYPSKLFRRKVEEYVGRLDAFASTVPQPPPMARVLEDDATQLASLAASSVDAVITSPPYVATYDYLAHHALRLRWLRMDATPFEQGEFGARRHFSHLHPNEARARWASELAVLLMSLARVMRPRAPLILLLADSAVGRVPIRADQVMLDVASRSAFVPVARASQSRNHYHLPTKAAFQDSPRAEHVLLLTKKA